MHHFFEDRQSLIRAVIAYRAQGLVETLQPDRGGLDSMEALRAWRDLIVDTHRQRNCEGGCPLGSLVGELAELFPECRGDLAGGFDQWEAAIRKGLHAMRDRGDLRRKANPDRLATAMYCAHLLLGLLAEHGFDTESGGGGSLFAMIEVSPSSTGSCLSSRTP